MAADAPAPSPTLTVQGRYCLECGRPFIPVQRSQEFCGPICRQHFNNRVTRRCRSIYAELLAWRRQNPKTGRRGSPTPVTNAVDAWLAEDRMLDRQREARRKASAQTASHTLARAG